MREKILVPLDGTALAEGILPFVVPLAREGKCELILFNVLEPRAGGAFGGDRIDRETALTYLQAVSARLSAQGVAATPFLQWGYPAWAIETFAARHTVRLIAMSTHGRTGLDRFARGSITESVLRATRRPLLLVNPHGIGEGGTGIERRYRSILVAMNGSEASAQVLPTVTWMAKRFDAEVLLVHCIEPYMLRPGAPLDQVVPSVIEGEQRMEPFRRQIAEEGLRVRVRIEYELPAKGILDAAEKERVDIVAMTTHGRTGLPRLFMGSVAEEVLRACPRPLLIVRNVHIAVPAPVAEPLMVRRGP